MIREGLKEDADAVIELFKIILTDMELSVMESVSWSKLKPALVEAYQDDDYRQNYRRSLVKVEEGEIAGFCFGYIGGQTSEKYTELETFLDKYAIPSFATYQPDESVDGEWYLDSIVIKDEYRGKGLGTELLEAACQKAKSMGVPNIGLNVDHGNPRAKMLYQSMGFKKTGEVVLAEHNYDHMQKPL